MTYVELVPEQQVKLLRERLLALEADHFRTRLLLTEEDSEEACLELTGRLSDLERRIAAHTRQAADPEPEPAAPPSEHAM